MNPLPRLQVAGAAWLREVTDEELIEHIGRLSYERALGYVDAERVQTINTGDGGRMILATVSGGRDRPYTSVLAVEHVGAPSRSWRSQCSCPMQERCKHVGAMVLTARELLGGGGDVVVQDRSWREFSDRFLRTPEAPTQAGDLVGLRVASVVRPRGDDDSTPRTRFELIPCRQGRTGRWNMSIPWTDLRHDVSDPYRPVFRQEQAEALERMLRSWQMHTGRSALHAPRVFLDELGSGVWDQLITAQAQGVTLLPPFAHPEAQVSLRTDAASVRFETTDDDGLVGRLQTLSSGSDQIVWLGDPPHGYVLCEGHDLTLVGLDEPLSPLADWVRQHRELHVPPQEAKEFAAVHLPRLQRRFRVQARRGGGFEAAPEPDPLRLRIHVRPDGLDGVRVEIGMRYAADRVYPVSLGRNAIGRDRVAERAVIQRNEAVLRRAGLLEAIGGIGYWPVEVTLLSGVGAVEFFRNLPILMEQDDLEVVLEEDLPDYSEAEEAPLVEFGAQPAQDNDWLDLHVTVTVGGELVPFEELFTALVHRQEVMVLDSGTWFPLDHPDLIALRDLIAEAREMSDRPGGPIQVSRFAVDWWAQMDTLAVADAAAQEWRERVRWLSATHDAPATLPDGLQATLRPYQHDGFSWLTGLWEASLGGVLADDMGLGKTLQTLALLAWAHEHGQLTGPVLVVAPSSVVGTWVREAATFTPGLPVVALTSTSLKRGAPLAETIEGAAVVVTSYTVLRMDAEQYQGISWRAVIIDEAQFIKNYQSKTFQAAKRLRSQFTLAITGTPLENSLMDLWSMLALAAPGLFARPERFAQRWRKPIEAGDAERLATLRRRIRPLMLRRTKELVAADLPPKQVQVHEVRLTPRHDATYKRHLQRERQRILGMLDDPEANRIAILASLTRLRQLALDPRLVDDDYAVREHSAKIAFLVEQLSELAAEGHRALVFSQFTSYLKLAREALTAAGVASCYLDGSTTDRQGVIDAFKDGAAPAFLISLKAGGTGLTLTEADYVFVLDPWWNPAAENQAIDRAHRIGQQRPVMVYRLVSAGTIEEKVVSLQERKRDLFARVVDGGDPGVSRLSADDLRALLTDD